MSNRQIQVTDNICRVCFQSGKIKAVEKLANGTAMLAIHEDGTEHHWLTYNSLDSVSYRKREKPKIIVCPKCSKRGRLGEYHPKKNERDKIDFYVYHGKKDGYWGKDKKVRKSNRCYIYDPEHRDIILKKLGRYIG
jgi:hypothetical protein